MTNPAAGTPVPPCYTASRAFTSSRVPRRNRSTRVDTHSHNLARKSSLARKGGVEGMGGRSALPSLQFWDSFERRKGVMNYLHKIMSAYFPCGRVIGLNASGRRSCRELATALILDTADMFEGICTRL
jgi:hypothetical protein